MKKSTIYAILIVFIVFITIFGLKHIAVQNSNVMQLAKELKTQGLNYDKTFISKSTNMFEEVTLQGKDLLVKITHYGNGLFMKNIVSNLEKDKKNNTKAETAPIYVARQFVIVVYQEAVKDSVKSMLLNKFQEVSEY